MKKVNGGDLTFHSKPHGYPEGRIQHETVLSSKLIQKYMVKEHGSVCETPEGEVSAHTRLWTSPDFKIFLSLQDALKDVGNRNLVKEWTRDSFFVELYVKRMGYHNENLATVLSALGDFLIRQNPRYRSLEEIEESTIFTIPKMENDIRNRKKRISDVEKEVEEWNKASDSAKAEADMQMTFQNEEWGDDSMSPKQLLLILKADLKPVEERLQLFKSQQPSVVLWDTAVKLAQGQTLLQAVPDWLREAVKKIEEKNQRAKEEAAKERAGKEREETKRKEHYGELLKGQLTLKFAQMIEESNTASDLFLTLREWANKTSGGTVDDVLKEEAPKLAKRSSDESIAWARSMHSGSSWTIDRVKRIADVVGLLELTNAVIEGLKIKHSKFQENTKKVSNEQW